jgi:hypothetical protein
MRNSSGLLTTCGGSQEGFCFLWAWQPQAAKPTGNKARAAGGGEESGT